MFEHSIDPALEFVTTLSPPETAWHYISYMTADKTIKIACIVQRFNEFTM
jgi:hypothetical protein